MAIPDRDLITRTLGDQPWIPYVGAGISLASGIPLAAIVVREILGAIGAAFGDGVPDAAPFLAEHGFEQLPLRMETTLEECEQSSTAENPLLSGVRSIFRPWSRLQPNPIHDLLASRLADSEGTPVVITTNIDCLIEKAFHRLVAKQQGPSGLAARLRVLASERDYRRFRFERWSGEKHPLLIKLHGTASDSETIQMSLRSLGVHVGLAAKEDVLDCFAAHYSFGFFGYSGWDDFDLLPILSELKTRYPLPPWVWLSHLTPGSEPEVAQEGEFNRVHAILGDAVMVEPDSVRAMLKGAPGLVPPWRRKEVPSYRLFGETAAMLGLRIEQVTAPVGSADAVRRWLRQLKPGEVESLVVRLFRAAGKRDAIDRLLENGGLLSGRRGEEHLFGHYLGCLKDRGTPESASQMENEIRAHLSLTPRDRARALSQLAFAWRDQSRPLKGYRTFCEAQVASEAAGPAVAVQIEREMLWGYRDLAVLVTRLGDAFPRDGDLPGTRAALLSELTEYGLEMRDYRAVAKERAAAVVRRANEVLGAARSDLREEQVWRAHLVKVLNDGAWVLKDIGEVAAGLELLEAAEEHLKALGDVRLRVKIWRDRAWFHWDLGMIDQALHANEQARRYHAGLVDELEAVAIRRERGQLLSFAGRIREGLAELERARAAIATLIGDKGRHGLEDRLKVEQIHMHRALGEVLIHLAGGWDEGMGEWLDGLALAKKLDRKDFVQELTGWIVESRKRLAGRLGAGMSQRIERCLAG